MGINKVHLKNRRKHDLFAILSSRGQKNKTELSLSRHAREVADVS